MATQRKDQRFDLRASPRQAALIKEAAETSGRSYTDFILDSAMDRAADVLADRRLFLLDDERWTRFEAALEAPTQPVPQLVELFRRRAAANERTPAVP